jgi:ABC-type lipoprotein export system ATPase subunit
MLNLNNISKYYINGEHVTAGIKNISAEFSVGEFVAITGASGSGKTTLMNILSGTDFYSEGKMLIDDEDTEYYDESDWQRYRKEKIGFIYQNYNLIENFNVYQNIELSYDLNIVSDKRIREKEINDIIDKVGLGKQAKQRVATLSGGQKQRVAIARALAKNTSIILADEPTGNLDKRSAQDIINLLKTISNEKLVIVVTHSINDFQGIITREINLSDGKIIFDKTFEKVKDIENKKTSVKLDKRKLMFGLLRKNFFFNKKNNGLFLTITTLVLFLTFILYSVMFQFDSVLDNTSFDTPVFGRSSDKKMILVKQDKSSFSDSEIEHFSNNSKISRVNLYDVITSMEISLPIIYENNNNNASFYVGIIDDNIKLTSGRMPTSDDEVIAATHNGIPFTAPNLMEEKLVNYNFIGTDYKNERLKIVGYTKSEGEKESTIYFTKGAAKELQKKYIDQYGEITINNEENGIYFKDKLLILVDFAAEDDIIYTSDAVAQNLKDIDQLKYNLNFSTNLFERTIENCQIKKLKESEMISRYPSIATNGNLIIMSENTLTKFIGDEVYQISIYLKDSDDYNKIVEQYENQYFVYYPYAFLLVNKDTNYLVNTFFTTVICSIMAIVLMVMSLILINKMYKNKIKNNAILFSLGYGQDIVKLSDTIEMFILLCFSIIINLILVAISKYIKINNATTLDKIFIPLSNLSAIPIIALSLLTISFYLLFVKRTANKKNHGNINITLNSEG